MLTGRLGVQTECQSSFERRKRTYGKGIYESPDGSRSRTCYSVGAQIVRSETARAQGRWTRTPLHVLLVTGEVVRHHIEDYPREEMNA